MLIRASLFLALFPTLAAAQWSVTNLHPTNTPSTIFHHSAATAVRNGQQVGSLTQSLMSFPSDTSGIRWSGSAASFVSVSSEPLSDCDGIQQVNGTSVNRGCIPVFGCNYSYFAHLYSTVAPTYTLLGEGPENVFYGAYGVDGIRQVGCANGSFAALWFGSAASLVNLHPAAASFSVASDVRGDM